MVELLSPLATVLVLLPALVANGSPVLLRGRGHPLDMGRRFIDGRPLLGKGKTFEGLALGTLNGTTIAYFLSALAGNLLLFYAGAIASFTALLGDIAAAFIKRRLGLRRGAPAPVLDQLDFYAGALLGLYVAGYIAHPLTAAAMALPVAFMHRLTNKAAHMLGLKDVPW